ncbi:MULTISPECIES: methyl-accepting chemotaxis protein [Pantoea]|uniref:Methyl-accepting chemotaxis protein n=1 Tax=Pantoea brenneri TaxID=472694 RepID=A0ABU9MIS0_9GAMM|nr:methyl-accepting chemotaxis protein [Pantoea sp. 3.5.1]KKD32924.1 chemoreceptor [Pantoea sp. 3.5.1]
MSLLTLLPLRGRNRRFSLTLPGWLTSLRGHFILFVVLFCLLQSAGIVLLTAQVSQAQRSLAQTHDLRERLALLDRARIELLTASDDSHRAGIYLMQDQQSGSVDSWKSLAESANASLSEAERLFSRYQPAPDSALQQSFILLSQGLTEQLKGLAASSTDAFFMVPMQAYQQQFNDAWFGEISQANRQLAAVNRSSLASLTGTRNVSLLVTGLLSGLLVAGGVLLLRGVITPLQQASRQLQAIATGDLLASAAPLRRQSRETLQLFNAMDEMRQGLRHIIHEIDVVAVSVAAAAGEMQHANQQARKQHQAQNASFSHLSQRLHRVSEEVENSTRFSLQATDQAQSADRLMQQCAGQVDQMESQMRHIVQASGDIAGIVDLLDSLSLQTRLLALNAAIESAHAGIYGRSFSVVAKEIGLLSTKSGHSTRQIDQLIQHTRHHVDSGFSKVKSLETLFGQIGQAVSAVVTRLNELQHNASAQSARVSHIAAEVEALNQQLQASEGLSVQQSNAADALHQQASRLAQTVQQFRHGGEAG